MKNVLRLFFVLLFYIEILSPRVFGQDNTQFHYLQTQMYLSSAQPSQAFTHIQMAIELDPTRAEFFVLRALCWRQLDRSDLFLEDYQYAVALDQEIIQKSFAAGMNLPKIFSSAPQVDTNPYVHDPKEFDRKFPQTLGPRLGIGMELSR
ncbi:MAG: hypothetical protein AAF694_25905 [Bacteroidota bacterium]